jgi:outer membrane protein insertion porin family
LLLLLGQTAAVPALARAQSATAPAAAPSAQRYDLRGRTVEDVRVVGTTQVSSAVILNLVRTRPGDRFDPATVSEDYQRIFGLRKFSNVEAKVEPTSSGGVVVVFVVTEQRQVRSVAYRGNLAIDTDRLKSVVDVKEGEAIDRFRIAVAKQAIEQLYRSKNFPFAHVDVPQDTLAGRGDLVFNIVEGPNVTIRNIDFVGARSYSEDRLKKRIQSKTWVFVLRPGTFDPDQVDDDVGAVRRFYEEKGFFDSRVGRKLVWSPDMRELQIDFLVEEGVRYTVDRISFRGNSAVAEAQLRRNLKLREGMPFDNDLVQRDIRQIVREYSPFGYIYQPQSTDPDYLNIQARPVYGTQPGKVELVYDISEGKPFRLGRIIVKGNEKTQDKVVLREMRVAPGQLYNSGAIQDAQERLRGTPFFTNVNITPVGEDPNVRDVLVEVAEGKTASFNVGAGVNSNGGIGGNITYEQRNFDITNWPSSWRDLFSDRAFVGAGQTFRASFEPGTTATNVSLLFSEPFILDQPYGFTGEAYLRDRSRINYDDTRIGGRVTFSKRFSNTYTGFLTFRGEDVEIHNISDDEIRAQEIVDAEGHSTLTAVGLRVRRDTTNRGLLPSSGTTTTVGWDSYGALGGNFTFQKFSLGWDGYTTVSEDLLDRKTILEGHVDAGWIWGTSPFFERFYGGGIGSIRGFSFRGVSPRSGPDDDPIGGDFALTGSLQLSFPLAGDNLRGVVFTDAGTVEESVKIGTIRSSVGAGIRLVIPFLGQTPIALDFAFPLSKNSEDETQIFSFSFGFSR